MAQRTLAAWGIGEVRILPTGSKLGARVTATTTKYSSGELQCFNSHLKECECKKQKMRMQETEKGQWEKVMQQIHQSINDVGVASLVGLGRYDRKCR
eukprot:6183933-Pleurochrysis_carterae.AAC.3